MEVTKRDIYVIIETLRRNNSTASEIYRKVVTAWGDVISERRVREIVQEFSEERRTSFERHRGSGRKVTDKRLGLIEEVQLAIEEDPHLSCRHLALLFDASKSMIYEILSNDLEMMSVNDRIVPYTLSQVNKENRVKCCKEILDALQTRNIKQRLVHTDEKFFYCRPMGSKSTRTSWIGPYGDYPTVARRTTMEKKMLVLVAVNFAGLYHFKVLEFGETVNSDVYMAFLNETFTEFSTYELRASRKAVLWENAVLYHDNARPHVSRATIGFLQTKNCIRLPQPPYSPDTNILDRFVFPKLEMERSKISFNTYDDLRQYLEEGLQKNTEAIMTRQFEKMKVHCQKIIDQEGNYIV